MKRKIEAAAGASGESLSEYCERVLAASTAYIKPDMQELMKEPRERSNRKTLAITLRVSEKDKEAIARNAATVNLSVGEYLIRAGLDDSIVIVVDGKEMVYQLSKIGTNLNQLTILARMGKITCPDIENVNKTLKKVLRMMAKTIKSR